MPALGSFVLLAAFVVAAFALAACVAGARTRSNRLIESGIGAFYTVTALMTLASGVLVHAFVTDNYAIKYVQRYSDSAQPLAYKIASYWGGLDGSIMFWVLLLSAFGAVAVQVNRVRHRELIPYVVAVVAATEMFFIFLMIVHKNPFSTFLTTPPADGAGLNPLLQNFYMAIHPPSLYVGFVAMTIPFAFGIAALITGHLDDAWLRAVRRWTMIGWLFLSFGLTLGHALGVRGARVGRLLGLGSGRERRPAAVVHRDGVSALSHGAGAARHAARLERHAGHPHVLPDDFRHVHDAVRRGAVGARVRRGSRARLAVHDFHGRDPHLQLRPRDLPPAAAEGAQRAGLVGVAGSGIPGEQLDPPVLSLLRPVCDDVPDAERSASRASA